MTTSGTYAFNPGAGEIFLAALSMCGIRRANVTGEHLTDAAFQANLLMGELSNRNPHQWAFELQSVACVASTAAYSLATRTISVAVAYIETTAGSTTTARVLGPMSASEYYSLPNKATEGVPATYWLNLAITTPTITLYPVPDDADTYTLKVASFRQLQDIAVASGETADVPYRFLDAFTSGLAARLAVNFAPDRASLLRDLFEHRFIQAAAQDQERVNLYIVPGLTGYFR